MADAPGAGSSVPSLPDFVTHKPTGHEADYINTLYACAVRLGDELCSAQAWVDKDLVSARTSHTTTS